MPAPAPPVPRSPLHGQSNLMFGIAAFMTVMGLVQWQPLFALAAASCFWGGWRQRIHGTAAVRTHASFQAITRGQVELAEAHLDAIAHGAVRRGTVAREVAFQRALIAFYRGDPSAAIRSTDPAIMLRTSLTTHDHDHLQRNLLLSLRALAKASRGDNDGARADAAEVEASSQALPEALSRARLAEAVVLARRGALDDLTTHLRTHGSVMVEYALPRERVLYRALRKMVQSRKRSVYREPAKPAAEESADALGSWVAQIAPEVAGFTDDARFAGSTEEVEVPQPSHEVVRAVERSRDAARKSMKKETRLRFRGPVLALVVGAMLVGVGTYVIQTETPSGVPMTVAGLDIATLYGGAIALVFVVGVLALAVVRSRRQSRDIFAARRAVAIGDMAVAAPLLDRLAATRAGLAAAQAWWLRALHAERLARFDDCIAFCDRAIASIQSQAAATRAVAAFDLMPSVLTLRAVGLAAHARETEANAELATVASKHATFGLRSVAELRVRLLAAVRRGDLEMARAVARERTPELGITIRDELLADLVLALSPEGASRDEQERLDSELRDDPMLRTWIDTVAPALRDELARRVTGGMRIEAPHPIENGEEGEDLRVAELVPDASPLVLRRSDG